MPTDRRQQVRALARLYAEVHEFAASQDCGQKPLALRKVVPRSLQSQILLLAQGLAQSTQRMTGYPYRKRSGLSPAGARLDEFLRPLCHTIDHTDKLRTYAYSTDLVPWYPGKHPRGRGDLRPTTDQIARCWGWFERECELVQPQAIVLLGGWATDHFLRRYSRERLRGTVERAAGRLFQANVAGRPVVATAAYHPSAVWGRYEEAGRKSWARAVAVVRPHLGS